MQYFFLFNSVWIYASHYLYALWPYYQVKYSQNICVFLFLVGFTPLADRQSSLLNTAKASNKSSLANIPLNKIELGQGGWMPRIFRILVLFALVFFLQQTLFT